MITTSKLISELIGPKRKKRLKKNIGLQNLRTFNQLEKRWKKIYAKAKISRSKRK